MFQTEKCSIVKAGNEPTSVLNIKIYANCLTKKERLNHVNACLFICRAVIFSRSGWTLLARSYTLRRNRTKTSIPGYSFDTNWLRRFISVKPKSPKIWHLMAGSYTMGDHSLPTHLAKFHDYFHSMGYCHHPDKQSQKGQVAFQDKKFSGSVNMSRHLHLWRTGRQLFCYQVHPVQMPAASPPL